MSSNQFASLVRKRLTRLGPESSLEGGLGVTAKMMVDIIIPTAVITAPMVKPSLLNNSLIFLLEAHSRLLLLHLFF